MPETNDVEKNVIEEEGSLSDPGMLDSQTEDSIPIEEYEKLLDQ